MSSYKLSAFPILILVLSFFASLCLAQIEFTHHAIANYSGAQSIYGADMDGDGDMDLVATGSGAQTIQWWENDGEQGFETHVIVQNFTGAQSAFALDVDGDGDIDVIGAASGVDDIIWCENDGEMNFETHVVNGNFDGACCVNGVDLDLDGDIDLVGAAADADDIAWWENDGNQDFEMHTIDDNFNGPKILDTEDVDGDGDIDVLAAGWHGHYISWFENDGDQDFTEHTIVTDYSGAKGVYAADLDDDGDTDVITCAYTADDVDWWENDGDENFTQHNLTGDFDNVWNVYADDIDLDGDMDVLAAARSTRAIYYWENDGEGDFTQRTVAENWNGAIYMHTADVDSDGDLDVFGAAYEGARIAWFESNLDPVPDASLEGTVSDGETGDLVEDAIVRAGAVRDTTDANGNYFIDDVLSGERTVIVTHTDYSRHVEEIEIEAGENTLDMELFPLSTVSGTVTDIDTGDPVEDAEIRFGNDETTTDENGDWEVPPQEQGERLVVISADHYYIFSEQVEVEPGENVFEFELIPLATITGTITDSETEAAVEDAEIVFGDFVYTAVSDENGDYSIEDVEAGEYPVTITTDGYFEFTDDIEVEERENEIDFSIDILSGDLTGVVSDEITEELLFEATITVI
ncbi:MAG: carboxypeptidase regulatory-like domain-containing protein, partial [Candidatus Electryonea clarkiae]|nr:carboxypeptidase regulatory-like domain-containing protein [Candidatus Electryonea clarkiae]